ncbi:MAG: hypothetical protein IPK83_12735 [Planctomycetes bacterium]|nr:hypothetical protein [Planctomycetota bacterium]
MTDDDVRWWWGLSDLERRLMVKDDEIHQLACFIAARKEGQTEEAAMATVRKIHPVYSCSNPSLAPTGEDRILPLELKRRINEWRVRSACVGPEGQARLREILEGHSSFNALVRAEIRAGRL